jgi:hypothetical protein
MKSEPKPDERDQLSSAVHALKLKLGPRVTALLLYHQALDLTREADELAAREEVAKNKKAPAEAGAKVTRGAGVGVPRAVLLVARRRRGFTRCKLMLYSSEGAIMLPLAGITAVKTGVFKLHNPSRRKRAMLDHALLHNHLAYTKALRAVTPLIKSLVEEELREREADKDTPIRERKARARQRKWKREAALAKRINKVIAPLPICGAARTIRSIPGSIIGQIESHLELHDEQDAVGLPTVQPLRTDQVSFEAALHALVSSRTKEEEDAARNDMALIAKAGQMRPLLFAKNRVSDGFLLLRSEDDGRYFVFLNLVPEVFALRSPNESRAARSIMSSRAEPNRSTNRRDSFVPQQDRLSVLYRVRSGLSERRVPATRFTAVRQAPQARRQVRGSHRV